MPGTPAVDRQLEARCDVHLVPRFAARGESERDRGGGCNRAPRGSKLCHHIRWRARGPVHANDEMTNSNASTFRLDKSAMSRLDPSTHDAVENAYLLVFEGASSRAEHLPLDGDVVIGRGDGAQVRLVDKSVSRAHARISMRGGRAEIVDLASQNGTKVNGERIVDARPVLSGDVISSSRSMAFAAGSRTRSTASRATADPSAWLRSRSSPRIPTPRHACLIRSSWRGWSKRRCVAST
jgi:hypothetical protein